MRLLAAILVALPALATNVVVERNGVPVEAEVCRFPAGDRDDPFRRWLQSQELTCVAAGPAVDFPAGLWNVFARTSDAVSPVVLVDGAAEPPRLPLMLRAAEPVTALAPPGASAVAYAPRMAVAYPLPALVPKDEPVWLMVVHKAKLVSVVPVVDGRADARNGGAPAVIGWVEMSERDRAAVRSAGGLTPPAIRAAGSDVTRDADQLPRIDEIHGAFVRFREVPQGQVELTVKGRGWLSHRRPVQVSPPLTVVREPLVIAASGTLMVYWSTEDDLPALEASLGSCSGDERAAQVEISVSACPASADPASASEVCHPVHKEIVPAHVKFATFTFDDLAPGLYRAEMSFGKLPRVSRVAPVAPLQQQRISLSAHYGQLYGTVTLGGKPLEEEAKITFPTGLGFAQRSGEYRGVVLAGVERDAQIPVAACDGEPRAVVLNDRRMGFAGRLDIDIPDNELTISVTDTFTREPLGAATVKMDLLSFDMRRVVMTRTFKTDDDGRVVVPYLPERQLRLTVTRAGYQRQPVDPFSMSKFEKKELEVQLLPVRGSRGQLVSARPFEGAMVFWHSASGQETERADVSPDGTFVFAREHGADETLTVVSFSHPLWVGRSPRMDHRQAVTLRFPDAAPVHEFEVAIRNADYTTSRYVGLSVGGVRVPLPSLRLHRELRGQPLEIRGIRPLKFTAILETGPIDVLLGPPVDHVPVHLRSIDLFALPAFADPPRQRLGPGASSVVFDRDR